MITPPQKTNPGRILVVDDTPENITVLVAILREEGYQISVATNGRQALESLSKTQPDLILLDIMMPEMDGFETCQRIKNSAEWHSIPIIFLTALTETRDIVHGFELGAVDYVFKPFNPPELLARVNTHLTMNRLRRENERLLLNILPAPIAERLKAGEEIIADHFDDVTVLFADIVGFTELASALPPLTVVEVLNDLFTQFDQAAQALGIEKVKTIGDAYMAVCGMLNPCQDHAQRMIEMGLRMIEITRHDSVASGRQWQIRIGIHRGPVVAGIIGQQKFIYDLWGDTVNLASRMESHGIPGAIQVTRAIVEGLEADYAFEARGQIHVKGKGPIETWLLKPHL